MAFAALSSHVMAYVSLSPRTMDLLTRLLRLELELVEAYEAIVERLHDEEVRGHVVAVMNEHVRHSDELAALLRAFGLEADTGRHLDTVLAKGKLVLASVAGERAILRVMAGNETHASEVYREVMHHPELPGGVLEVIGRCLLDEERHSTWLEHRLDRPPDPRPRARE